MKERIADHINILGRFCGKRDIAELTQKELKQKYGFAQADVMVLFGGSILCGANVLAEGIKHHVAKKYVIVGGAGHTTQTLRDRVHQEIPAIETDGLPEAQIFEAVLKHCYGLSVDYLECESTNCGNNITFLLELLKEKGIDCNNIILSQDATMQHRMEAVLRNYADDITIINYAVYSVNVIQSAEKLNYDREPWGMWDMKRYINLLLGEIPRLTDDENGYGSKGKGFIAHVDIPDEVRTAFDILSKEYSDLVREANPAFASK